MTLRTITLTALAAAAVLTAAPAAAQVAPDLQDLVTQGEQLNRGVEGAVDARTQPNDGRGTEIDGEAGIYVLRVNEIFFVSAGASVGYSSNPQRTADDLGGSGFADVSAGAGIATRLGGMLDFGLAANISGREFFESDAPSSRDAAISASLGRSLFGPVYGSVVAFGGYSFDGDFGRRTGFYGVAGSLSAVLPVNNRLVIRPGVGVTRQWAQIAENDSVSVTGSVDLVYAVTPQVTASLRGSVTHRWYDDFYEDVTFVARRDTAYGIAASLSYRPHRAVAISAQISYERQSSSFFLADFEAMEGLAGISLRAGF